MTGRWIAAFTAAVGLGLLTLPVLPGLSLGHSSVLHGEVSAVAACDADAQPANLDFTLKDMNGEVVNLTSFRGKVILINFWATWCGPCKIEIPWFVDFQEQYADDGLVVLGVSMDDTPEQIVPFAEEYKVNYPMLVGREREDFQEAYGPLWGIPVTVLVDRDGKRCRTHMGIATREEFQRDLDELL